MMDISFDFERADAIPISILDDGVQSPQEWAAAARAAYTAAVAVPEELQPRLEGALATLAARATPDARSFLLVGTDAAALAPLTIVVARSEFTRAEQAEFLWSPSAVLPPAPLRVEAEHLGVGFSSTLAQREDGEDFGTRRWLFFGRGMTVGAVLGPVAPYLLAVVEPLAEGVLHGMRVDGFEPLPNEDRVAELVSAVVRIGDEWTV
ncbi:hypothetical protein [Streptomyces sp. AC495_CC817]|uniref:hypothetical protein n=1 Tax=Streptomyces sp. AC495_CC817 TaxID=2823900 RepID=UPI001C277325|nr:hypothetical protein [Streptomyces sp. AC495_CC817]